jgi:hypothetical protein
VEERAEELLQKAGVLREQIEQVLLIDAQRRALARNPGAQAQWNPGKGLTDSNGVVGADNNRRLVLR